MSEAHTDMADPKLSELPPDFAHEAEHPQVRLPFTAIIGKRRLRGESLSLTRAVATGLVNRNLDNTSGTLILRFDFEGFTVNLPVEATLKVPEASEDAEVSLILTNPTGPQLPVLRYILNSAIAGDVVSVAGMLAYTGPVKVKPTNTAPRPGLASRTGRFLRKSAVAALTLGLVLLAGNIVAERVLHAYEARPVRIVSDGQVLRATAAGQVSYTDLNAAEGEVVYSILANSGDLLSVRMPCDCTIAPGDAFVTGATVLPGTPLVQLSTEDTGLTARTEISFDGTAHLLRGDAAQLVMPDGAVLPVTLELLPQESASDSGQPVSVVLPPDTAIEPGTAARLRFERSLLPANLTSRITALMSASAS